MAGRFGVCASGGVRVFGLELVSVRIDPEQGAIISFLHFSDAAATPYRNLMAAASVDFSAFRSVRFLGSPACCLPALRGWGCSVFPSSSCLSSWYLFPSPAVIARPVHDPALPSSGDALARPPWSRILVMLGSTKLARLPWQLIVIAFRWNDTRLLKEELRGGS